MLGFVYCLARLSESDRSYNEDLEDGPRELSGGLVAGKNVSRSITRQDACDRLLIKKDFDTIVN